MLLWDGGNNDLPFYTPDVWITLVDPLRAGHELTYHPGEANLRAADVVIVNKMDSATPEQVAQLDATIGEVNPTATVVKANSKVTVDDADAIRGKRVLVVEDGPTLTHGSMKIGAGVVAAQRNGAAEIVDPRPWAFGTIADTFEKYDVGAVLPAMGYSDGQLEEMEKIIEAADADLVVIGTPIDLRRVIDIRKPAVRVRYDLEVLPESPQLADVLKPGARLSRTRSMERVVVALGGNALLRRGADDTFEEMYRACREAAERIADIAAEGWQVVVTHGNGPQVGRILLQQEAAAASVHPMPLDVCGAQSQGQIGYLLQVTIGDVFFERGMERPVATVLTLTRVRPDDPAFTNPTKFVGSLLRGRGGSPARNGARIHDEGRSARWLATGRAEPDAVLDRRDARDRPARRRRCHRDRERWRGRARHRGRPAAHRARRAWSTRISPPRSSPRRWARRPC